MKKEFTIIAQLKLNENCIKGHNSNLRFTNIGETYRKNIQIIHIKVYNVNI